MEYLGYILTREGIKPQLKKDFLMQSRALFGDVEGKNNNIRDCDGLVGEHPILERWGRRQWRHWRMSDVGLDSMVNRLCHRPWLIGGKHPRQRSQFTSFTNRRCVLESASAPPKYSDLLQRKKQLQDPNKWSRRPHTICYSHVEIINTSAGWISCS